MWDEREWLNGERASVPSPHKIHPGYHRIYFPSQKNHHSIHCEGKLEAAYCVWLEWDEDVTAYGTQPHTFCWKAEGRTLNYTPDFFVQHRESANHFTEVKYDFSMITEIYKQKLSKFYELCNSLNMAFKLADRQQLVESIKFINLRYLYFRSLNITQHEQDYLSDYLTHYKDPSPLRAILSDTYAPTARSICHQLFKGELLVNLNEPLTLDSPISRRDPL